MRRHALGFLALTTFATPAFADPAPPTPQAGTQRRTERSGRGLSGLLDWNLDVAR